MQPSPRSNQASPRMSDELDWKFVASFGDDNSSDGMPQCSVFLVCLKVAFFCFAAWGRPTTDVQSCPHARCACVPPSAPSNPDDLVTAVEFDETGEYIAVGDKAGRICIFEGSGSTEVGDDVVIHPPASTSGLGVSCLTLGHCKRLAVCQHDADAGGNQPPRTPHHHHRPSRRSLWSTSSTPSSRATTRSSTA